MNHPFPAAQTFKYAVGTTYQYKYDGKIEISLSSAEGQTTSSEVKADVSLTQLPECNQLLTLQNVQILGANGKVQPPRPTTSKITNSTCFPTIRNSVPSQTLRSPFASTTTMGLWTTASVWLMETTRIPSTWNERLLRFSRPLWKTTMRLTFLVDALPRCLRIRKVSF